MEAKLSDPRLVISGAEYLELCDIPSQWEEIFKDGNYSAIITGSSGSGKDSVTGYMVCNDLAHGRTVIIMDVKMEYGLAILGQGDPVLRRILVGHDLAGKGYKVNLWIPYTPGMEKNAHFKLLRENHHPNLRVRPFRIFKPSLISEDTANMSLQKSYMQSIVTNEKKGDLHGNIKKLNEVKEEMGKMRLAMDDDDIWEEGCGWEYIDFEEMTKNKEINVISTFFMLGQNITTTISFNIGILNELMTIGKSTHRLRGKDEVFSIVVPEVQIILPKGLKSMQNVVNTLQYSMLAGLLLMRSFGVRLRINLQNLSALLEDMLSQSRLFVGRTANPKDLAKLAIFNVKREERNQMLNLAVGNFRDIFKRKIFNVVPFFHKARENEYLARVLQEYRDNPAKFLFETPHGLLSEICNPEQIGLSFPCTVREYNRKVKKWISAQEPIELEPLDFEMAAVATDWDQVSDKFAKLAGKA